MKQRCPDCGNVTRSPLCGPCAKLAEALGLTVEARLVQLGAQPALFTEAS